MFYCLHISTEHMISEDVEEKPQQILCYLLVDPTTHKGALNVKNTWAQRCDQTIFFR